MSITDQSKIEQYKNIHSEKEWGVTSYSMAKYIIPSIIELEALSVLDYGCGQSKLYERLKINKKTKVFRYDPSIPEISHIPVKHVNLIINTDVLEHIPEEDINDVLNHMKQLGDNIFFNINTALAKEILPSGENAHCTVRPPEWWLNKIQLLFPEARIDKVLGNDCIIKTWPKTNNHLLKRLVLGEKEKWSKRFKQYKRSVRKRLA